MVLFDVESLFTSMPVNEAIQLTYNLFISDDTLEDRTPIPLAETRKLLEFCLKTTYFQFRNNLYEPTEGLTLGSPISPVIANISIIMEDLE